MSCEHCKAAAADVLHGGYHAHCHGCQVRSIANGPAFWAATEANAMTGQYRAALQAFFGGEWKEAHEEVKAEHRRIKEMKERK